MYKMVRHMVAAMISVGQHKITVEDVACLLRGQDSGAVLKGRRKWSVAPACGLCKVNVVYPDWESVDEMLHPQCAHDAAGRLIYQNKGHSLLRYD